MRNRSRIANHERQYKALEAEIADILLHKPIDELSAAALKRRLLDLRDEIFRDQFDDDIMVSAPIIHH